MHSTSCRDHPAALPVAQIIAALPADLNSFATGTNSLIGPAYNELTFRFLLAVFVKTIRQGHPQTTIAVVSPVYYINRQLLRMARQDRLRTIGQADQIVSAIEFVIGVEQRLIISPQRLFDGWR